MSAETVAMTATGGFLAKGRIRQFTNRLSGSTAIGGVYMLDQNRTHGTSTSPEASFENVVAVTAKGVGQGPLVVATEVKATGLKFNAVGGIGPEPILVQQVLVNANSVNIAIGDELTAVASQAYLVKTVAQGDYCGIAQAAATTDGALIPVILYPKPYKKT